MTRKPDLQSPESILARIRNQRRPGQTTRNAQIVFALERFLARVAQSRHREQFILKGGILLYLTEPSAWNRPTEDIDMLARNLPTEHLEQALADIMAVDAGDRVVFDPTRMTSEEIREEGLYPCCRFSIPYTFGSKHQGPLKLDLSFGSPMSPGPRWITLSQRFPGHKGGDLLGYPMEALLAEKIQTILVRGLLSTRAKDIFDVWTQARINPGLRLGPVVKSLRIVAAYRQTDLTKNTIVLTDESAESPIQTRIWDLFAAREKLTVPAFQTVMREVRPFLAPIHGALSQQRVPEWTWNPGNLSWG